MGAGTQPPAVNSPASHCAGKKSFSGFSQAARAAKRSSRAKGREGERYAPYRCTLCQAFHVGAAVLRRPKRIPLRRTQ